MKNKKQVGLLTHLVGHDDAGVVRSIESINPEDGNAEE